MSSNPESSPKCHPYSPHSRSRLSTWGENWCHMTGSRLLGGTWVFIWWIWELTESTQQKHLSKCQFLFNSAWYWQMLQVNKLLYTSCHADKKHSRTALVAVDFGQLLSNTKMEAQRTWSWRGLLPPVDTSLNPPICPSKHFKTPLKKCATSEEGKSRPLSNSSYTGRSCGPTLTILCTPWNIEIYWNTILPDLNPFVKDFCQCCQFIHQQYELLGQSVHHI